MNWQCDEARLSEENIAEIYRNMETRGLSHVCCQACSEEMKPEQARRSSTGLNLEEQRRLMYVAMTRAMERLIITHRRTQMGQPITVASRFLREIDA